LRSRIAVFVVIIQTLLFIGHWFLYKTWLHFWGALGPEHALAFKIVLALLSISFVSASLLAFRFSDVLVRGYYTFAAAWLGTLNFLFLGACACWIAFGLASFLGLQPERRIFAFMFLSAALLASAYGIFNAGRTRVKRISVTIASLPQAWQGRTAALVSDVHLGHVRNTRFIRRIVSIVGTLHPDIVFITGDLYDGTSADLNGLAKPWSSIAPALGKYFVLGNHEGFTDSTRYLKAVEGAGIRILDKEKIEIDGLQLVGVHYHDATHAEHFRSVLQRIGIDCGRPSILLTHAPDHLPITAEAGISLQLSGQIHHGQFFPFNLLVRGIYGQFAYGLSRLGATQAYTTSGAGTWGPPLRVGTNPEIVLIRFE
jgi:uncharacterized protein